MELTPCTGCASNLGAAALLPSASNWPEGGPGRSASGGITMWPMSSTAGGGGGGAGGAGFAGLAVLGGAVGFFFAGVVFLGTGCGVCADVGVTHAHRHAHTQTHSSEAANRGLRRDRAPWRVQEASMAAILRVTASTKLPKRFEGYSQRTRLPRVEMAIRDGRGLAGQGFRRNM
jgi:hypothetical protein